MTGAVRNCFLRVAYTLPRVKSSYDGWINVNEKAAKFVFAGAHTFPMSF